MKAKVSVTFLFFIGVFCFHGSAQDINLDNLHGSFSDRFKGKKWFGIGGGINLSSVYTATSEHQVTVQPLTYVLNGSLKLRSYSWSAPFSFTYSNNHFSYSSPNYRINRISLQPHYKSWTLHAGDFYPQFSSYSLSGFQVTGAGVEYKPKGWQLQAVYGRLLKAVAEDTVKGITPVYQRMGWGWKAVYGKNKKRLGVSLFHAEDARFSIPKPVLPANQQIRPMESSTVTIEAALPLAKDLVLEGEHASSVVTNDLLYPGVTLTQKGGGVFGYLLRTANPTTTVYHAGKVRIQYSMRNAAMGMGFEQVDPGYSCLGNRAITPDQRNITIDMSKSLYSGRLTIAMNTGLQSDDLNGAKQSRSQHLAVSGNIGVRPNKKANINITYSDFRSTLNVNPAFKVSTALLTYMNPDTINYTQVSRNVGCNMNWQLSQSKEYSRALSFNANYMEAGSLQSTQTSPAQATRMVSGTGNYSFQWMPGDLSFSGGCTYTLNYAATGNSYALGPSLNWGKSFWKKVLRTNGGISYNKAGGVGNVSGIWSARAGAAASVAKKHNLNLNLMWQDRTAAGSTGSQYFTATAGYSFTFK